MKKKIQIFSNSKEDMNHYSSDFPVFVLLEDIHEYENSTFACHWHTALECIRVIDGELEYIVDGVTCPLSRGEGIIINSGHLHFARAKGTSHCKYEVLLFDPLLLLGPQEGCIISQYVLPLLESSGFSAVTLRPGVLWQEHILTHLHDACVTGLSTCPGSKLKLMADCALLFSCLYEGMGTPAPDTAGESALERIKAGLEYLQTHYKEPITLAQVSAACHLSDSECCRQFRRLLHQSVFEYLQNYRIRQSLPLLKTNAGITEIALSVGFNSGSYYSEIFRRHMRISPREYRKQLHHS